MMKIHAIQRRAMVRQGRESLAGVVEVDETYVGGVVPGRRGRGALGKAIVAISVERLGVGETSKRYALGRARLQRVPNVQMATLTDFVLDTCDLDAVIYTDHWGGYNDLGNVGHTHVEANTSASGDPAHIAMPCVHRVASLLKRWLLGRIRAAFRSASLTSTWTSSCSGSTGAGRGAAACSSTG
jgi:transposase-like protein